MAIRLYPPPKKSCIRCTPAHAAVRDPSCSYGGATSQGDRGKLEATSPVEKIAIIGRETMRFAIIELQTSTSLKGPMKRWHFVIHDIWSF